MLYVVRGWLTSGKGIVRHVLRDDETTVEGRKKRGEEESEEEGEW